MSRADSQLDFGDLRPEDQPSGAEAARRGIWLNGDVAACACPDCGSPMTIRLWLMAADCWVCGASVVLSEEQQREVERLLEALEAQKTAESLAPLQLPTPAERPTSPPQPRQKPAPAAPVQDEQPSAPAKTKSPRPHQPKPLVHPTGKIDVSSAPPARTPAAQGPGHLRRRMSTVRDEGEVTVWFRDLFRSLPAWLISALLHMALLILLAMVWDVAQDPLQRPLILSTKIGPQAMAGADEDMPEPDPVEFNKKGDEEPKEKEKEPEPPGKEDPKEEQPFDAGDPLGDQPNPFRDIGERKGSGAFVLSGRNPQARKFIAEKEGATRQSEAAVARGLVWLSRHQNADGSWSLHRFHRAGECRGRCKHPGNVMSDSSATAMALLPFLGAGETHVEGMYQNVVRKGLKRLVAMQKLDGDLRGAGNGRMYAHGQAAIVLCEAFAMTKDETLRAPAQAAIDFIVKAQHSDGGWRYVPTVQAGDISVTGWQYMALRSGQLAYLHVPGDVILKANRFVDSCRARGVSGTYGYMTDGRPKVAMTAEALLCRQYSGWARKKQELHDGCRWLLDHHPPRRRQADIYYWYYAAQVMHHMGGEYWTEWNSKLRDMLVAMQETRGHQAGSWTPVGPWSSQGGRLYMTSLAVCTLEVYYRHLPLYRKVAVDK